MNEPPPDVLSTVGSPDELSRVLDETWVTMRSSASHGIKFRVLEPSLVIVLVVVVIVVVLALAPNPRLDI